jgi:hypothetical protein
VGGRGKPPAARPASCRGPPAKRSQRRFQAGAGAQEARHEKSADAEQDTGFRENWKAGRRALLGGVLRASADGLAEAKRGKEREEEASRKRSNKTGPRPFTVPGKLHCG